MKLLTINTHSLVEQQYEEKLHHFMAAVLRHKPDVIAMQEVNQSKDAAPLEKEKLSGMAVCREGVTVREDNHAANIVRLLREAGLEYYFSWLPMKIGYDKYDEGLAILCRRPIVETDAFLISSIDDYHNWKTRWALGVKTEGSEDWFYTVHMGWWKDAEEPFLAQWETLDAHIRGKKSAFLMGDFNSRADVRNEGYDRVLSSGWLDTYEQTMDRDEGFTVGSAIDGWKDKQGDSAKEMRIDYIFSSRPVKVNTSRVIFNGKNEPVISDHYGLVITVDDKEQGCKQ